MVGVGFAVAEALGVAGQFASGLMSARARQGEFDEQLRRIALAKEQTLSMAQAQASASGVELGSKSTQMYLASLASEFDIAQRRLKKTADVTGKADFISNLSRLVGGGASLYGDLAKANNYWG